MHEVSEQVCESPAKSAPSRRESGRHSARLALSILVAAVALGGCSGNTEPSPSPTGPSATSTGAPTSASTVKSPSASSRPTSSPTKSRKKPHKSSLTTDPTPVSCAVSTDEIAVFRRDWDRVVGSVGREDHKKYTAPFVAEVNGLATKAESCPGAGNLAGMKASASKIDAAAQSGKEDFRAITDFAKAGNSWLDALGYGSDLLATS